MLLGQSADVSDEKLRHLRDEPLPDGLYGDDEHAIVHYARASTRMQPIDDELYAQLETHFDPQQLIVLCYIVGLANMVNRFHATFHTPLNARTQDAFLASGLLPDRVDRD
jgi:alkylhydroperoxidase family enzyme